MYESLEELPAELAVDFELSLDSTWNLKGLGFVIPPGVGGFVEGCR